MAQEERSPKRNRPGLHLIGHPAPATSARPADDGGSVPVPHSTWPIEFLLLGPLEVRCHGTVVAITASQQRSVLVSLLRKPGRVVPLSSIVSDLWGQNPPDNAVATVRNYVGRLRATLPVPVVETAPSGYVLAVPVESVDTHRFAALVAEARRRRSSELFARARTLWRGEPLSDLGDTPVRDAVATAWRESYLSAVEDHTDLRIAQGEYDELVPELIEMSAAHPLRERLSGQLMVALYAGGRAADALGVYRSVRSAMTDELGIEPGRELRTLEQAILRDDTSVLPSPEARSTASGDEPVPVADLVGRDEEIAELLARFAGGAEVLASSVVRAFVFGQGGCGKSALAVHVGHAVAAWYRGGIVRLDLGGSTPGAPLLSTADVLRQLVGRWESEQPDPGVSEDELARRYGSALAGSRTVIVLDNAASYAQVSAAVRVPPGCAVLVTSRVAIEGPGVDPAELVHLDALTETDAVELLARFAGGRRVRAEEARARALAGLCGRLPLALRLIGCRMARQPYWSLAHWQDLLADERRRLDEIRYDGASVRASLVVGLAGLERGDHVDADALHLFPRLGLVTAPYVTPALGAALTGWATVRASAALDRLVAVQVMFSVAVDRYAMFDLVAILAREQAAQLDVARRDAALSSASQWYLAAARRCSAGATGWSTDPGLPLGHPVDRHDVPDVESWEQARDWLDREFPVLVAVMGCAADAGVEGIGSLVVDLLPTLPYYVNNARVWHLRVVLAKIALTSPGGLAAGYRELAIVEAQRGDVGGARALVDRARSAVVDDGSYDDVAVMLTEGTIMGAAGRLEGAAAHLAHTAEKAAASGFRRVAIIAEHNVANVLRLQGRAAEALERYRTTYRASIEIGDLRCASGDVTGMLLCCAALDRHHDVVALTAELAAPLREPGASLNRVEQLLTIALSLRHIGDRAGSDAHVDEAMQYLASIGRRERVQPEALLARIEDEISLE